MEDKHNRELDNLLDAALSGYSDAEPLAGLEQRVVTRIRIAETRRKRFAFWGFAAVLATAMLVVITLSLKTDSAPRRSVVVELLPSPEPTVYASPPPPRAQAAEKVVATRVRGARVLPKAPQFPSVGPLTSEERALLALVSHPPAEEQKPAVTAPIEIPAIEIKPLETDGSE